MINQYLENIDSIWEEVLKETTGVMDSNKFAKIKSRVLNREYKKRFGFPYEMDFKHFKIISKQHPEWFKFPDELGEKQLTDGNRNQYASFLPHIELIVSSPLKIEKSTPVKF